MNNADMNPCIMEIKHNIEKTAMGLDLQGWITLAPVNISFFSNAPTTIRQADIALFFLLKNGSKPQYSNSSEPRTSQALSRDSLIFLSVISNWRLR